MARTGLYADLGGECVGSGRTVSHFFDEPAMLAALAEDDKAQQRAVDSGALRELRLEKFLGGGGSGLAFLCQHPQPPKKWVVKLAKGCVRPNAARAALEDPFACAGKRIADVLLTAPDPRRVHAARIDFAYECRNAEFALEPPEMREDSLSRGAGQRMQPLRVEDYRRIVEARRAFQVSSPRRAAGPLAAGCAR